VLVAQVSQKKAFSILPIGEGIVPLGMQGKKHYPEKLFNDFRLSERVSEHNFYRRLNDAIDLRSLYPLTKGYYLCPQGKVIPFKKVFLDSRTKTKKKSYRASSKICKGCPLRATCLGKVHEKQFSVTYYRAEYERNIERVNGREGR